MTDIERALTGLCMIDISTYLSVPAHLTARCRYVMLTIVPSGSPSDAATSGSTSKVSRTSLSPTPVRPSDEAAASPDHPKYASPALLDELLPSKAERWMIIP